MQTADIENIYLRVYIQETSMMLTSTITIVYSTITLISLKIWALPENHPDPPNILPPPVKEVQGFIHPKLFFSNYQNVHEPVIFRGGAQVLPAFGKWTDKYLK